jgi:hypothetical protein
LGIVGLLFGRARFLLLGWAVVLFIGPSSGLGFALFCHFAVIFSWSYKIDLSKLELFFDSLRRLNQFFSEWGLQSSTSSAGLALFALLGLLLFLER